MKSIILVAGRGTRMGAISLGIGGYHRGTSKPLLPVFDKPGVYYALSDSIAAGIRDTLIIAAPDNVDEYKRLLGDGSHLGINIEYAVQDDPKGIAEAFIIGEQFIGNDDVTLMFGDNLFNGKRFTEALRRSAENLRGASIFALRVPNPSDYGVVEFDSRKRAISLEEKPEKPKSDYAVPGNYRYTSKVVEIAKALEPSARGELEITDVNMAFLEMNLLDVQVLDDDTDWFDTGNPFAMDDASSYVRDFQERHPSILIGSPEATAFKMGFIDRSELLDMATNTKLKDTDYGIRLRALAEAV